MKTQNSNTIEVIYTPALFEYKQTKGDFVVVVVDVFRATTTICQAFASGAKMVVPVSKVETARDYKNKGYLIAGERGGEKLSFAHYGNSPVEIKNANLCGKTLVVCTTNGTHAIETARKSSCLVIGSFSNFEVLNKWLVQQNKSIVILCSGWKDTVSLEDSAFSGALTETLMLESGFEIPFDSSIVALEIWKQMQDRHLKYLKEGSHYIRLKKLGAEDDFEYCVRFNTTTVIPLLKGSHLINIKYEKTEFNFDC